VIGPPIWRGAALPDRRHHIRAIQSNSANFKLTFFADGLIMPRKPAQIGNKGVIAVQHIQTSQGISGLQCQSPDLQRPNPDIHGGRQCATMI
jgi:hypothetical protein